MLVIALVFLSKTPATWLQDVLVYIGCYVSVDASLCVFAMSFCFCVNFFVCKTVVFLSVLVLVSSCYYL